MQTVKIPQERQQKILKFRTNNPTRIVASDLYTFWTALVPLMSCGTFLFTVAKQLEKNEDLPVEKVKLMEKLENQSSNAEFLDWDVYQYYRFLAERGDTHMQVRYVLDWVTYRGV